MRVNCLNKIARILRRLQSFPFKLSHSAISIVSIIIATYLIHPDSQIAIHNYGNLDTIFIAIGGVLATILVLAFSISIIPIQRALEHFSSSISRLYRKDGLTKFIFIIISVFSLLSFLLGIDSIMFGLDSSLLFPIDIVILGISLDLLRLHYRRICSMLEPTYPIGHLKKMAADYILKTQKRISKLARKRYNSLKKDEKVNKSCPFGKCA